MSAEITPDRAALIERLERQIEVARKYADDDLKATKAPTSTFAIMVEHFATIGKDIAAALRAPEGTGVRHRIDHDGFEGDVIGSYVTREGKRGVVLQQIGTKVVHVYGEKWLSPSNGGK